jgi:hypothetical protein
MPAATRRLASPLRHEQRQHEQHADDQAEPVPAQHHPFATAAVTHSGPHEQVGRREQGEGGHVQQHDHPDDLPARWRHHP